MIEETFEGAGGLKIFLRSWRPDGKARAVLACVHGFKAHGGLIDGVADQFTRHGIAVYALDLRGHGRSEGERLFVDKFADYVADVDRVVEIARAREPGAPIFVLGHSAGGVIANAYVIDHQAQLAGFVCESFAQEVPAPDLVLSLVKALSRVFPHAGVLDLKDENFSRDPAFVERMKNDPLIPHQRYPSHTVAELARADDRMKKGFGAIKLPVLILHGTVDKVTRPSGSQLFYETAGSTDKTLRLYEGHFHDLLNDVGKEQVMTDITTWIDAHVDGGARASAPG